MINNNINISKTFNLYYFSIYNNRIVRKYPKYPNKRNFKQLSRHHDTSFLTIHNKLLTLLSLLIIRMNVIICFKNFNQNTNASYGEYNSPFLRIEHYYLLFCYKLSFQYHIIYY